MTLLQHTRSWFLTLLLTGSGLLTAQLPGSAASPPSPSSDRTTPSPQRLVNYCRPEESLFLSLETKSFWINICGGDLPHTYIGYDKATHKQIRLPLKTYTPKGTYFEAINKNYTYILAQTPKGKFLTVSRNTQELLREPILRGW